MHKSEKRRRKHAKIDKKTHSQVYLNTFLYQAKGSIHPIKKMQYSCHKSRI